MCLKLYEIVSYSESLMVIVTSCNDLRQVTHAHAAVNGQYSLYQSKADVIVLPGR